MDEVEAFAKSCEGLTNDEIYELLYPNDELRERIFQLAVTLGATLQDSPEPTRYALNTIGEHFNVQSLIDY